MRQRDQKGYSLMEIIVCIALMGGAFVILADVFGSVSRTQRLAAESQNIQESTRYALEAINKEIRTAIKSDEACMSAFGLSRAGGDYNKVYNVTDDAKQLVIKNKNGICSRYYVNAKSRLAVQRYAGGVAVEAEATPSAVIATGLKFDIIDDAVDAFHEVQPKVTYLIRLQPINPQPGSEPFRVQTTISSRHYE